MSLGRIGVNFVRNPSKGWPYLQAANFACAGRYKNKRRFSLKEEQSLPIRDQDLLLL